MANQLASAWLYSCSTSRTWLRTCGGKTASATLRCSGRAKARQCLQAPPSPIADAVQCCHRLSWQTPAFMPWKCMRLRRRTIGYLGHLCGHASDISGCKLWPFKVQASTKRSLPIGVDTLPMEQSPVTANAFRLKIIFWHTSKLRVADHVPRLKTDSAQREGTSRGPHQ